MSHKIDPIMKRTAVDYAGNLERNSKAFHYGCVVRSGAIFPGLQFTFSDDGILHGSFAFAHQHQGYDDIAHGGLISLLIDASMAQCLMGHDIIAYTVDLKLRYRLPIQLHKPLSLRTRITGKKLDRVYSLASLVEQNGKRAVEARAYFMNRSGGMS